MKFFRGDVRSLKPLYFLLLLSISSATESSGDSKRFIEAAVKSNLTEIKELLQSGVEVDVRDNEGATALIRATQQGALESVKFLIGRGADVNAVERLNGASALMFAVRKAENEEGKRTAPIEAKVDVGRALIRAGANVNQKNHWGGTALQWACDSGNLVMVRELITAAADVRAGDSNGLTPLMVAANYEGEVYLQIVRVLLSAKAEINATDRAGETALMKASLNHFKTDTIKLLMDSGADVNVRTRDGFTALMLACRSARVDVIDFLIDHGADAYAKTNEGLSVFQVAKQSGYKDAIQALIRKGITK